MRVAIIILGVLFCSTATEEPQPWMKKENPDSLSFVVAVDSECPFIETEIREIANGVLIRSRLRPGDYFASQDGLGFAIELSCLNRTNANPIFDIDVRWINFVMSRLMGELFPMYGSFGTGDEDLMKDALQEQLERLVTDYLQANFDLAPEKCLGVGNRG